MRRTSKIILTVIILSMLLLGIGYAAIQNVTLNIVGTVSADPSQSNFKVMFVGTPVVSDEAYVTAAITDDTNATINVEGLTLKGQTVSATYDVQNVSTDLSADLSLSTTNNNTEYFTISSELEKTSLVAGEATTVTVTVELTKTPITDTEMATIGVQLEAIPVQPGEEGTSESINGSSQTPGELEDQYQFEYYSSVVGAVTDVNNAVIGENADVDKADAVAGIYTDENGNVNVMVLKDTTEESKIAPTVDMTINLNGHSIYTKDVLAIEVVSGNVTIDGNVTGSSVRNENADLAYAYALKNNAGAKLTILGGTYVGTLNNNFSVGLSNAGEAIVNNSTIMANSDSGTTASINNTGTLTVSSCELLATSDTGKTVGINATSGSLIMRDSNVLATANDSAVYGVFNKASATINNCEIKGFANYDMTNNDFGSLGMINTLDGTLTINDSYVVGTHSGIQNHGILYLDGGTYESYAHGGLYLAADGTTSYVRNAIIRHCEMPEGYTAVTNSTGAAFYMNPNGYNGATTGTQVVYMDSCDIYAISETQTISMADTDSNILYISNSTLNNLNGGAVHIRIDSDSHQLYIGAGNNFDASITDRPSVVTVTDETYIYEN